MKNSYFWVIALKIFFHSGFSSKSTVIQSDICLKNRCLKSKVRFYLPWWLKTCRVGYDHDQRLPRPVDVGPFNLIPSLTFITPPPHTSQSWYWVTERLSQSVMISPSQCFSGLFSWPKKWSLFFQTFNTCTTNRIELLNINICCHCGASQGQNWADSSGWQSPQTPVEFDQCHFTQVCATEILTTTLR